MRNSLLTRLSRIQYLCSIMRIKSIFLRIFLNVLVPVLVVFSVLAYYSYINISKLHKLNQESELNHIKQEVEGLISIQNQTFNLLERLVALQVEKILSSIDSSLSLKPKLIAKTDLNSLLKNYNLDSSNENLYIINAKNGKVVNTTLEMDRGANFFELGKGYKSMINKLMSNKSFVLEKLYIEGFSARVFSYSYYPSKNGKYLMEMGMYSKDGDEFMEKMRERIDSLEQNERISKIDIFLNYNKPFSIYDKAETKKLELPKSDLNIIKWVMENNADSVIHSKNLTKYYSYYRSKIDYSGNVVLRVIYDNTTTNKTMLQNIIRNTVLFGLGLILLVLVLIYSIRKITTPLQKLTQTSIAISKGDLSQRTLVEGNDEVSVLAETFNEMVANLEKSTGQIIKQRKVVEVKNREILDSITYAKRIQEAILPSDHLMKTHLPDSFVLYKPKDIVAGDFYWLEIVKDKVVFAAADCTGHGVPGAMVCVVCYNAMNRAVREFKLKDTNKILDKTRELVIDTFAKSDKEVKDGMDISLCSLDREKNILTYSGANNGIYLVRNFILTEIKADKQPIGLYDNQQAFKKHKLKLQKGDTVYLYTDGYADQFGGPTPNGKKFKYQPFKELIISVQNKPMDEQMQILNETFEAWRGDFEQIDDVCVIGFRV